MTRREKLGKGFETLTSNSRFWILTGGITVSFLVAGVIQLYIPPGSDQSIRIEQTFAFISLGLLYIALLASPLLKVFSNIPFKKAYTHARRPIGVLAFYYAFLHAYITFFNQLGGVRGIAYYNGQYELSIFVGLIGLAILCVLTLTSMDWVIRKMTFKNWKRLQRLIYIACVGILLHVIIIGTHYTVFTITALITYSAVALLLILEVLRIRMAVIEKRKIDHA
jgi:DMSO/TMAO reductase YedYZ heme-binding membrane subunit